LRSKEIRERFLKFFEHRGHTICPSSSLIPENDPTLLFVNAGMVQFKGVFLGLESRPYARAVSCQKCVRAGGKHNDLENVGKTLRHHTFFEMLGNFSFGDYFKKEAIAYAWEFVTKELNLEKERIWITVFKEDSEAEKIWQDVGVKKERIVRFGEEDNFWAMGDEGPCGPCSEIHYDMGEGRGCGRPNCGVNCDCDRFVEVWNLVFMQYNRSKSGEIKPLPKPSIDTGMGLERISAIMQDKKGNYETDLFLPIIRKIESISGSKYGESEEKDIAMRVIADHIRGATFIIGDGVLPSRDGRGYVLRRIIRRAMRYGKKLGIEKDFLSTLSAVVSDLMGEVYPEIRQNHPYIAMVIKAEEERFRETLSVGTKLYEEFVEEIKKKGGKEIPGDLAYKLYDTYGFPLDLTMEMANEDGLHVDMEGFNEALMRQKERSKEATRVKIERELACQGSLQTFTEPTVFLGYERLETESRILHIIKNGSYVQEIKEGEEGEIIIDLSPFYAEGGGQISDQGLIEGKRGKGEVLSVQRTRENVFLHRVKIVTGSIGSGEIVRCRVDAEKRKDVSRNHTATHLLHYALRTVLGDHVRQKGSLVERERLRFDFTHFRPMDDSERWKVEELVNRKIMECVNVETEVKSKDEAIRDGAIALFEEKYGDYVRVVKVGDFSKELCGGTHVRNTGEIGPFIIVDEGALASGVRRIEALTGSYALKYMRKDRETVKEISSLLNVERQRLSERILSLNAELKEKEKQLERLNDLLLSFKVDEAIKEAKEKEGVKIVSMFIEEAEIESLRRLSDMIRSKSKNSIAMLGTKNGTLLVAVSKGLEDRYNANGIMKRITEKYGGKGGGSPNLAQGGIPKENIRKALSDKEFIL
jgi:alanyl-tRNA synthetase